MDGITLTVDAFTTGTVTLKVSPPLVMPIKYDSECESFCVNDDELGLRCFGRTFQELADIVAETLHVLRNHYENADDATLTSKAQRLKSNLLARLQVA